MEDQQIQNIEIRLRNLEQLHVWAGAIILIGVVYYFVKKSN